MAYTTIDSPKKYFEAKTYTGTGATQSITGLSFKPDLVWGKHRSGAEWNVLSDAVRGVPKNLYSNATDAEDTISYLTSLDINGFTLSSSSGLNGNGSTYVAWNWLGANTTVSNTSGTITSTVSANTTSGFSIVSYTGNATLSQTIGHGLGVAPRMIIFKTRSGVSDWGVYHESMTNTKRILLNSTGASGNFTWGGSPTSSVFYVNNDGLVNGSGSTYIAYCFAEVKGFSKMGSWIGNGSTDGTFVYTGFKPSFIMIKNSNVAGTGWSMWDSKRNTYNLVNTYLQANSSTSEGTQTFADFLSNGIKIRDSNSFCNGSGNTIIYMAFAENPFVSSKGLPCTAR